MKTAIVGIGNPLMGDDGAGIAVLDLVKRLPLPAGVSIVDGGTGGMALLHMLARLDAVVLVDAVDFGGMPGEIRTFQPRRVRSSKERSGLSLHEADLLHVIAMAEKLGQCPATAIICAIQPADISPRQGLSTAVGKRLPALAHEIQEAVCRLFPSASRC